MVESARTCLEEIEQSLCQLRALGILTYSAAQTLATELLKPDWFHNGKLMVNLAEGGLEAMDRLSEELKEEL